MSQGGLAILLVTCAIHAAPAPNEGAAAPRFLGAASCSSSGCHGGAASNRNQNLVWSSRDFHTRAHATLTTARSARMAEALRIEEASLSTRCTVCHAPFHELPAERKATAVEAAAGVSCESCHGPGETWLRSHTRPDWSHLDRVQAGMRDLKNLYVRANTCVACHQNLDADLLKAGHPELIFELDGQAVTQPKHWREKQEWSGPKAWLIGQAVALREMSWQLTRETAPPDSAAPRWAGLLWLLQKAAATETNFPSLGGELSQPSPENLTRVREWSDRLARAAAEEEWSAEKTWSHLRAISNCQTDFKADQVPQPIQARRAERLVLALDRLLTALEGKPALTQASRQLDQLFKDVQSLPDFDPSRFSRNVEEFQRALREVQAARVTP